MGDVRKDLQRYIQEANQRPARKRIREGMFTDFDKIESLIQDAISLIRDSPDYPYTGASDAVAFLEEALSTLRGE